jgi:uncharacterized membrane protein YhaH (DUF805 family)
MDSLFTAYTKYILIVTIVMLLPASIEAGLPAQTQGQSLVVRYGVFAKVICALLMIIAVFFALALASVDRASALTRIGMFATLGIPTVFLTIETFGKKVTIEGDHVISSYFGIISRVRSRSSIARVTKDTIWKMFRVYFEDGSTLWMSTMMRGSAQVAEKLNEKTA